MASEKGLDRLLEAINSMDKIIPAEVSDVDIKGLKEKCYEAMNDDLNTPILISHLFEGAKIINQIISGKQKIDPTDLELLQEIFQVFFFEIMGMKQEVAQDESREEAFSKAVDMLLDQRMKAKANKDWDTSDYIRDQLTALGFEINDTKDGYDWRLK